MRGTLGAAMRLIIACASCPSASFALWRSRKNIVNVFTEQLIQAVLFLKLHTAAGAGVMFDY